MQYLQALLAVFLLINDRADVIDNTSRDSCKSRHFDIESA